jgi:hypothetical protein
LASAIAIAASSPRNTSSHLDVLCALLRIRESRSLHQGRESPPAKADGGCLSSFDAEETQNLSNLARAFLTWPSLRCR